MKVTFTMKINECYYTCPYFDLKYYIGNRSASQRTINHDGSSGPAMVCSHPDVPEDPYIISHPDCDNGFPKLCPLIKEQV